ncbi:MAG: EF-P lysine aminoacylase GenX [Deltaproteobacteria bacterium]|nr:EF-P lysine aminoacylase GenX [Deltaproteobacteria bacterium]
MTWRRLARGGISWETLRRRSRILEWTRAFFRERGFLEIDPPIAQPYPNIDPNVFPVRVCDAAGRISDRYLHTSPELSMKKLLAAGSGNIFFLGKVFRDREGSPLHHPEFTMLEWYRVAEPADSVRKDVEDLIRDLTRRTHGTEEIVRRGHRFPLPPRWERWELADAFAQLLECRIGDAESLRTALSGKGIRPGPDETWEDLFFRAILDVIEPALAGRGAVFLTGFPAALAGMARRREGKTDISERFEGYVAGIELVNGYEELTDPREQEERIAELSARHERQTGVRLPVDPEFLDALRAGLPPCSGAALGMDRLVMLLLGKETIADVTYR